MADLYHVHVRGHCTCLVPAVEQDHGCLSDHIQIETLPFWGQVSQHRVEAVQEFQDSLTHLLPPLAETKVVRPVP